MPPPYDDGALGGGGGDGLACDGGSEVLDAAGAPDRRLAV
jgi:hypothetical protein